MNTATYAPHRFSIAPMMDWSDRHCRYFHRLLTRRALVYTEMITTGAVIHGDRQKLLGFASAEHPVALQLGGSVPAELAEAARVGADFGYDEINLNVGCPSDRVQSGRFGACLMAEPQLVAECIAAMQNAVQLPVSVKTRTGIDNADSYELLAQFVASVAATGCKRFIIHARKAWLQGLSPKQNRELPPLQYEVVYRLKQDYPELTVIINGGIDSLDSAYDHLKSVDGVMLGRAAYQNPFLLSTVDQHFFGERLPPMSRHAVIEALMPYVEQRLSEGVRLTAISRHVLGLFQGQPGAKGWRRYLSENAHRPGADAQVLQQALLRVARIPGARAVA